MCYFPQPNLTFPQTSFLRIFQAQTEHARPVKFLLQTLQAIPPRPRPWPPKPEVLQSASMPGRGTAFTRWRSCRMARAQHVTETGPVYLWQIQLSRARAKFTILGQRPTNLNFPKVKYFVPATKDRHILFFQRICVFVSIYKEQIQTKKGMGHKIIYV